MSSNLLLKKRRASRNSFKKLARSRRQWPLAILGTGHKEAPKLPWKRTKNYLLKLKIQYLCLYYPSLYILSKCIEWAPNYTNSLFTYKINIWIMTWTRYIHDLSLIYEYSCVKQNKSYADVRVICVKMLICIAFTAVNGCRLTIGISYEVRCGKGGHCSTVRTGTGNLWRCHHADNGVARNLDRRCWKKN